MFYLRSGAIWQLDLQTLDERPVLQADEGTITHVALSDDHLRLAYSVLLLNPTYEVVSSKIVVANTDGGNPQTLVHEETGSVAVGWPAWSGNGAQLVYDVTSLIDGSHRIENVDLATRVRSAMLDGGSLSLHSRPMDVGWPIRSAAS